MRAAIYIRRSRDEQSEYSPEAQERQCRLYCELHGFDAVKTAYVDDDYSGTRSDRPDFERMLDDARAGKIQAVVVHKLNRLARNAACGRDRIYGPNPSWSQPQRLRRFECRSRSI